MQIDANRRRNYGFRSTVGVPELIEPNRESIPISGVGDMTNFSRDVSEQALAHVVADETEAVAVDATG